MPTLAGPSRALVTAWQLAGSTLVVEGQLTAEADAQGHYQLEALPKGDRNILAVYPPLDQPYFMTHNVVVPGGPGFNPVTLDIPLKRARWITGRVTDQKTGNAGSSLGGILSVAREPVREGLRELQPERLLDRDLLTLPDRRRGALPGRGLPGRGVVAVHTDDRSFPAGVGAEGIARVDQAEPGDVQSRSSRNFTRRSRPWTFPTTRGRSHATWRSTPGGRSFCGSRTNRDAR